MKFLMVTDTARLLHKSAETVRNYERSGKLAAVKTSNGRRLFLEDDVRALAAKLDLEAKVEAAQL
jgi:DNA-binding transcriptional MerR regulator